MYTTLEELLRTCATRANAVAERAQACATLGQLRSREAVFILLGILASEDDAMVLGAAASALGAIRSLQVTRPLIGLLRNTTATTTRRAIVFALGALSDQRASAAFIKVLTNPQEDPKTRGFAAEALGLLHPTSAALNALIAALADASPEVRGSSLCGLGAWRAMPALAAIQPLLNDHALFSGDETIAQRAAQVSEDIGRDWLTCWNVRKRRQLGLGLLRRLL